MADHAAPQQTEWKISQPRRSAKMSDWLKTGEYSDVEFVFPQGDGGTQKTIKAHRFYLITASEVFEIMFFGNFKEEDKITIVDIEFATFLTMLKYIYRDVAIIDSVKTALDLCAAAEKYFIDELKTACVTYLNCNMRLDCILDTFEFAVHYNIAELKKCVWQECQKILLNMFVVRSQELDECLSKFPCGIDSETWLLVAMVAYANSSADSRKPLGVRVAKTMKDIKFETMSTDEVVHWFNAKDGLPERINAVDFLQFFEHFYSCVRQQPKQRPNQWVRIEPGYFVMEAVKTIDAMNSSSFYDCRRNVDRDLICEMKFSIENLTEIAGVKICTQSLGRTDVAVNSSIMSYIEDVTLVIILQNKSTNMKYQKRFTCVAPFNSTKWIELDESFKLNSSLNCTKGIIRIKYNRVGYYPVECSDLFHRTDSSSYNMPETTFRHTYRNKSKLPLIMGLKFQ